MFLWWLFNLINGPLNVKLKPSRRTFFTCFTKIISAETVFAIQLIMVTGSVQIVKLQIVRKCI